MLKSWPLAAAGGCNFGLNQFLKRSHFRIEDKIFKRMLAHHRPKWTREKLAMTKLCRMSFSGNALAIMATTHWDRVNLSHGSVPVVVSMRNFMNKFLWFCDSKKMSPLG